jgi:hypothetical protein
MRIRQHATIRLAAALALGALAVPAQAAAAHRPQAFDATASIVACGGDSLVVGFEVQPAAGEDDRRAAQRAVRAVRGARLLVRFEAAPLYGSPSTSPAVDLGRTTTGRRFERFADLPAQTYSGVVHYRWVRGSRTLKSGFVRTRRGRAAGRRGTASCSLEVGKPPVDTTAPFILPVPFDGAWKRGPLNVQLYAVDDLSGVALVLWRLDSGPVRRGRRIQITTEGVHRLVYIARDAAGNQTRPTTTTLRVDTNPPSAAAIVSPSGTTTDTTPEIRWNAATDSASGVRSYIALVRNAAGAIVWSRVVRPSVTSLTVPDELAPGQYTTEVYAFDGAGAQPFSSKATSTFSIVGTAPADSDGDGHADTADNCPFAVNADQADGDADGAGDACDEDDDNDGDADASDNCPTLANPSQANLDGDVQGDACDTDDDNDGDLDTADNCPVTANALQENFDGDAQGDACDSDDDNDGLGDTPDPDDNDVDYDDDGINDGADRCVSQHRGVADTDGNGCPGPT